MYKILGIPHEYRITTEEKNPCEVMEELRAELTEGYEYIPTDSGRKDMTLDEVMELTKTRDRIVSTCIIYKGNEYHGKNVHDVVINVLKEIVGADPQRMDSYCDIKKKRARYPKFSHTHPGSNSHVNIAGTYVMLYGGRYDLTVLQEIAQIYGIESDVLVRIRNW